jgi:hypothetical protein
VCTGGLGGIFLFSEESTGFDAPESCNVFGFNGTGGGAILARVASLGVDICRNVVQSVLDHTMRNLLRIVSHL